jgi:hypothetical protein
MPVVSKAQNAAMHAAAEGKSTLGIPARVGKDFVKASHGMSVKSLPQRVNQKKSKQSSSARKAFDTGRISERQMAKMG